MSKTKNTETRTVITVIVLGIMFALGWITNIVKLFKCDFSPISKAEIIRVIGIPAAPIGAIAGYITFDEEK